MTEEQLKGLKPGTELMTADYPAVLEQVITCQDGSLRAEVTTHAIDEYGDLVPCYAYYSEAWADTDGDFPLSELTLKYPS